MFQYYMELINKPKYLLSTSEQLFVEMFPLLILGAICLVIIIVCAIIEKIKKG